MGELEVEQERGMVMIMHRLPLRSHELIEGGQRTAVRTGCEGEEDAVLVVVEVVNVQTPRATWGREGQKHSCTSSPRPHVEVPL